jgi:predicted DNA-binding transcriptional regulator AlpA
MTMNYNDEATSTVQPLLTVEDLERMLRIDRRTVARLCKRGQLPQPLKIGGGNRWRIEDISETLDSLVSEWTQAHKRKEKLVTV